MRKYFDHNGYEIKAGMRIQIKGTPKLVLVEPCGEDDLGILAPNMDYVRHHPETELKYYPLSNFGRHSLLIHTEDGEAEDLRDDDFLCERNDEIDNAVFDAISALVLPGTEIEWSMELIGEVNEFIGKMLMNHNIPTCHPWHDENECICYRSDERCPHCNK